MDPARPLPLAHIRVLDLSRLLPGPMATLHLAHLGADVIRIEPVERIHTEVPPDVPGLLDLMLACSKRSIRIDTTRPAGRDIFLRLARGADVVVEAFRPGVADRLGIGYDAVSRVNPRAVYCSISGYGQTGPNRLRSGHDINYLACAGVADQIGVRGGPPAIPNLQIGDLLGGSLTAVMGILAGLVDVQARGAGRYIDVSMTDSVMAHSVLPLASLSAFGHTVPRGEDLLSGGLPCYQYYRTKDDRYVAVGALEPKFWERLCQALDRPDLKPKHMVKGEEARRVRDELQAIFVRQSAADWARFFENVDCCVTTVLTLEEAIASNHAAARGMVVETEHPGVGKLLRFAPPLRMSDVDFAPAETSGRGAAQTEEILRAAGYEPEEIAAFRSAGVIA